MSEGEKYYCDCKEKDESCKDIVMLYHCTIHDEPLPCGYCKTLEHLDNCHVYKKYNQCACLLLEETNK